MGDYKLLINGKLEDGASTMNVLNPATEGVLAECPRADKAQLERAIAAAKAAFPSWSAKTMDERRKVLNTAADIIERNGADLARLLTQEQGKPLQEATFEVFGAAAFLRYFTTLDLPVKTVNAGENARVEIHRRPLGVVAAIVPWNFPVLMATFKLGPALLAGNTVVLKPAPTTPLATLRMVELMSAVLPAGTLNTITDQNDLGAILTTHPDIRKVSFTGSTATGRKVMNSAADTLKRITLELGGNDAGIVLGDVNPKETAPKLFQGAFMNNGQVCIAMKRLYVHESIYDEMCSELAKLADSAVMGDGLEQGTTLGPLQNKMQYEKVKDLLEDSRKHGKVIAGGVVPDQPGYFIKPTIVRDIEDGARLVDEEQFGPILPVIKYKDPEEALARANASSYGLGGSVWSSDIDKAYALAKRMNTGTVWINKHADVNPAVPFGGSKQSGFGGELGDDSLEEYTQQHVINVAL